MLFSDVKGSTAMGEELDPEDVLEIMDGAFDVLIEPITRYEGALARLMGDGILAFFGAPIAHEDDAERACRAALEILEGARGYAGRLEEERGISGFNVRVGIHTGLVVVGEVGSDLRVEYTAMGDAVNTASRMEELAEPGSVLITEDTHRLIARLFEIQALGPIEVRGKAEPISVYRVPAPRAVVGKPRGIEGLESPLVGRDAEFHVLQEVLERLQAGVGGIVTLVGEAGIGKSRLVAELRKQAPPDVRWVEGRCLSYGESMAYLPWLDMLHGLLAMTPDASPVALRDALREWVRGLCPDSSDEVYPYLGRMMSLPLEDEVEARLVGLDAEALKFLTFRAMRRVVEAGAGQGPVVLVCEDLHWADASSLELLEHLLPVTDQASLLLICALRPYREHACWGLRNTASHLYHHRHTDVWLRPLSAADGEVLVGNLLEVEALPRPLRARILDHAEGNPFYVEEVIRALIDSEAVVQDEVTGYWQAVREVEHITIPDTLQGVLRARIDRLQEEARRVLQMASVVGRVFLYRVLAAITEDEAEQLPAHLVTLQREEMIRERSRVPELEYIFKHHLTQQAAYNGLLRRERRLYHRQVAEALERLFPDRVEEQLGLVAHQWEQAGERARAVDYLRRAGGQAVARFANVEAVSYFTRALGLTPQEDLAGRYELLLAREGVYDVQGLREVQRQELATLELLADALHDDHRRAEVAVRQARCAMSLPDYQAAMAAAQRAVRLAHAAGDMRTETAGYRHWAWAFELQGEYGASRSRLEQALALARTAHLRQEEAEILGGLGAHLLQQRDVAGGRTCYEQSLRLFVEIGDRRREAHTRLSLGIAVLGQGDCDGARSYYERAVPLLREIDDPREEAFANIVPGHVYDYLGDYDRARDYYERCLRGARELGATTIAVRALTNLGLVWHQVGDDEAALEHAQQALQMAREHGTPSHEGASALHLGHALAGLGRLVEAEDAYRRSLAVLRQLGLAHRAMEPVAGLGRLCLAQGGLAQAKVHVEEILSYLEHGKLGNVHALGEPMRVYLTCYRVLQDNGDPRAGGILEEGYQFLQERAAKISDEEERRSYLENVAANREIMREYVRRQGDMTANSQD